MWWDVGWVRWAQDAMAGFLDQSERVRTVFPVWRLVGYGMDSHNEHLVAVLTNSDLYLLEEEAESCQYLNYSQVLYQSKVGSYSAHVGKRRRWSRSFMLDGNEIWFKKTYADEVSTVVEAGTTPDAL